MTWDAGEPSMGDVFTPKLEQLLGPRRMPHEEIEPRHEAIAASTAGGLRGSGISRTARNSSGGRVTRACALPAAAP